MFNVSKLTPQEFEQLSNWLWNNCDDCGLMLEDMTDSLRYYDEDPADLDPSELEDWLLETRLFALDHNCPKGIKALPEWLSECKNLKCIEVDDDVEIPSCIDSTLINADYKGYSSYDYR